MALTRLDKTTFVDLSSIAFADFQDMDSEPRAILHFVGGRSETLSGALAVSFCEKLNAFTDADSEPLQPQVDYGAIFDAQSQLSGDSLPSIRRNKAWYYKKDKVTGKAFFMAFVNAKGSCSVRTFSAESGIAFPKRYSSGSFQDQFKDLITGAIEVRVFSQPNLERDCRERLPEEVFSHLLDQVK